MSEELFDKSNDNRIRQNGLIMNTDEVVDLLNSQSKLISAYQYEFVKMKKENEQLKEEREKFKVCCLLSSSANDILQNEIHMMIEQGATPSNAYQKLSENKSE